MRKKLLEGWQELIEVLPYPVYIHDTRFTTVIANKALVEIFGDLGNMKNLLCQQLFHCSDRHIEDCPAVITLKSGKPVRSEIYEPSLDKFLIIMTAPICDDKKLVGVIHSVIESTDKKESEIHYGELVGIYSDIVNKMKVREIDLNLSKEAFLNMLEDIGESYKELESLFLKLVRAMVNALDAKSHWTRGHSENVAKYAVRIAKVMRFDEDEIKNLRLSGLLHDIGKIGTYDSLLDKPGRLTEEEFKIVKKHPIQGTNILTGIKQLQDIIPFIRYHHERIDGKGYPDGLKGDKIPLGARILHVADSFDSMTADRPYRPAPGFNYAVSELKKWAGKQFDSQVVETFLTVLNNKKEKPR